MAAELCRLSSRSTRHRARAETRHRLGRSPAATGCARHLGTLFKSAFASRASSSSTPRPKGNVTLFNFEGFGRRAVGRLCRGRSKEALPACVSAYRFIDVARDAGGDARGFCIRCCAGRDRRGDRADRQRSDGAVRLRFRGLHADRTGQRAQDPARRVRAGRRLVSAPPAYSDAAGRSRLFLFRRPHRRHLRWKGERLDRRGRGGAHRRSPASATPMSHGASTSRHARAAPVHGDDRRRAAGSILAALRTHLRARLPPYARPLFVRIGSELELTHDVQAEVKIDLVAQGFDPACQLDLALHFDDPRAGTHGRPSNSTIYAEDIAHLQRCGYE